MEVVDTIVEVDSVNVQEAVEWLKNYPVPIEWTVKDVDLGKFNSIVDYTTVARFVIMDPQVRMIFKLTFGGQ
jgi:hypothetical protein